MFVDDDGPFMAFRRLRQAAGITHYDDGSPTPGDYCGLAKLLTCVWCISVWVGAFMTFVYFWVAPIIAWFALPFALSGFAILVEEVINGDN